MHMAWFPRHGFLPGLGTLRIFGSSDPPTSPSEWSHGWHVLTTSTSQVRGFPHSMVSQSVHTPIGVIAVGFCCGEVGLRRALLPWRSLLSVLARGVRWC